MQNNVPRIKITRQGDVIIVQLLDKEVLEEHVIAEIGEALFTLVAQEKPVKLVLDFSRVNHMSSSTLGMLIRLSKHIGESGSALKLCAIKPTLYNVFEITKLDRLFEIYDTKAVAVKSF